MQRLFTQGQRLYASADYVAAHRAFLEAAAFAHQAGDESKAAFDWSNAGACSVQTMQFGPALKEFLHAQKVAQDAHQLRPLLFTLNSLASLYIQTGQYDNAIRTAREALNGPAGHADEDVRGRLVCEIAKSIAELKRFDEAVPYYVEGVNVLLDAGDLEMAARVFGVFGNDSVTAGKLDEAEWALAEGLLVIRARGTSASANILLGLARLRSRQGRADEAATLFESALAAPPGSTPKWKIYAERGRFRLDSGDPESALQDFRESRAIVSRMRADMVPADQDRVTLESGLSEVVEGLVDAGNRVVRKTGDRNVLKETFEAAEQDHLWSLRALIPATNDWRARLPEHYWELLSRYQSIERTLSPQSSAQVQKASSDLRRELQQIEAGAAGDDSPLADEAAESPLDHVRNVLDDDSILLSFHLSKMSSWVWAVDRSAVNVYHLPPLAVLEEEITQFAHAVQNGSPADTLAARLYQDLFGLVPETYLRHSNWRLELDGPLYKLPFAALLTGENAGHHAGHDTGQTDRRPIYLMQRAVLQSVPGAILMKRGAIPADQAFLGVGDAIYNTADPRYRGEPSPRDEISLPRLPNTASELEACARAWNSPQPLLLTGEDAQPVRLQAAIARCPAIIHFATHVIAGSGDFQSGLIALSLDPSGTMKFLGPRDIVARPAGASLVVMNGCHSARGEALPGAGLMGLTRAWIGAGASAVLATEWDVKDTEAQAIMGDFYRILRASPHRGPAFALREAQLSALRQGQPPSGWAAYSLLSRIP